MNDISDNLIDDLISGKKRTVKLKAIWDYKPDYIGKPSLHNRSAGYTRVALPHLEAQENESEEFRAALDIVKKVQEKLNLLK